MSVAWTNMKSWLRAFGVALVAMLSVGCSVGEVQLVEQLSYNEAEHTLIMYLIADNNLASSIYQNAIDAEKGMVGALPQARLVVYLDNANETTLYEISYRSYGSGEHVRQCKKLNEYPQQTSTTPKVMKSVLEDIKRLAPSRSYGLVMASHGSGWFPEPGSGTSYNEQKVAPLNPAVSGSSGVEYDFGALMQGGATRYMGWDYVRNESGGFQQTDESFISTAEVAEGLSPIHFDYIIFDACFMASVEFLYEVKDCADYIIASPVEILSCGLPYEAIVGNLMSKDHNLADICDIVMDVYMRDNDFSFIKSLAIALIDCSELEALARSVAKIYRRESVGDLVTTVEQKVDLERVQVLDRMKPAAFYDLEDYVCELTDDEQLLTQFREALAKAVITATNTEEINSLGYTPDGMSFGYDNIEMKVGGKLQLCGLSCYVPRRSAPVTLEYYTQTKWAQNVYFAEGDE